MTVKVAAGDVTIPTPGAVRWAALLLLAPLHHPALGAGEDYLAPVACMARKALGRQPWKQGLIKMMVIRQTHKLVEGFEGCLKQNLFLLKVVFLDGIRPGVVGGTREEEVVLVAHVVLTDGRRVALGSRESTRAWTKLFEDLEGLAFATPC